MHLTTCVCVGLGRSSVLKSLHLGLQYLSGELPSSLSQLTMLRELDLHMNFLSGYVPSFMALHRLEQFIMNGNPLISGMPALALLPAHAFDHLYA